MTSNNNDRSIAMKGGLWTGISTLVTMLTQILRLVILTRFLAKEDFGIVSITNSIIALCLYFTDLGFASVIMYKQELSKKEFSSLFWIQAVLFLIIYIVLVATSSYISSYYNEETLKPLVAISGLSLIGQAVGKLYDSILLKNYLFKMLAVRNIITNIVSLIVAWFLACRGAGAYSLVFSTLIQLLLINIWNFISGYKYKSIEFFINVKAIFPLIKIGIYQTGTNMLDFISNKLDVFIIGKVLGMEILGVYDLAKELVLKFVYLIRTVVSKVALPLISNNNDNADIVKQRFLSITKIIASICIPICITLAVFSEEVVRIMYGDNFLEAVPIVTLFAFSTMMACIASFFDMLGIAKGRTDLNFKQTVSRIIITTPMILFTTHYGILAVAWGQLIAGIISITLFWFIVVRKTYPIPFSIYSLQFKKILFTMLIIYFVVGLVKILGLLSFFEKWQINMLLYLTLYILLIAASYKILYPEYRFLFVFLKKNKIC